MNWLSPRVYNPAVATRYTADVARSYERGEAVYVLLTPTYRSIAVIGSGSGRAVSPRIAGRARRIVARMFGEQRRASRPMAAKKGTGPTGRARRGSRPVIKKRRSA